jgi:hypothetical protein
MSRKLWWFFQADLVDHAGGHRHRGDAGGADQRVDLAAGDPMHDLAHHDAGGGADAEGERAEHQDAEGLHRQELVGGELGADGQAEHDGDDVDDLVLGRPAQPLDHAAFAQQVAEGQHADQRRRRRQQQRAQQQHDEREQDALQLRDRAHLLHHHGRSFSVVSARMIGGWMMGTSAM